MFRNAQVGDRVWGIACGWGEIIETDQDPYYPIRVRFDDGSKDDFTSGGELYEDENPTLFWSEIPIPREATRPPKRKQTRWVYFYLSGAMNIKPWWCMNVSSFSDKAKAKRSMAARCVPTQGPFPVEIEVDR